jgi:hypothetical protein
MCTPQGGDQLSGRPSPKCKPSLKLLDMAFQGLGLHLGVVVIPHVVKQATIVVQEFLAHRNPVLRASLLAVSGIFSRRQDVILHRDSTLQRRSWVRNLLCLVAVINPALGYGAGRPSRPST